MRYTELPGRYLGATLIIVALIVLAARGAMAEPVPAATPAAQGKKAPWSVEVDYRLLVQGWQWFRAPAPYESACTFAGNRLRVRLNYKNADVQGLAELQDVQMVGLPTHAVGPAPIGQLGLGGSFEAAALRPSINTAGLRQAWLRFGRPSKTSAQLGRFDYSSEMEVATGDPAWGGGVPQGIFPGRDASLWLLQYDLKLP